ncbi:MAG: hypothetical protein AAB853_06020 [Patescibacteria group bacterium]
MPTPTPLTIPTGEEIYDALMSQIEPELTSSQLPLLAEKYKDETPDQKEVRRKRYNAAFAKYDELYTAYVADMDARIHRYHREALRSIEEWSTGQESKKLDDIAASFFKFSQEVP